MRYFKLFVLLNCFILTALFLKPGGLFYESGIYVNFLDSLLNDFDLNIINQVRQPMAWLLTKTYYHPALHPESQAVFLLPAYFLEYLSQKLAGTTFNTYFCYQLASLFISFASVGIGFHLCKLIAQELSLTPQSSDFAIFYFGTPLFYFSLLQVTVIEISAFPAAAFIFWNLVRLKKTEKIENPIILGAACGFLFVSKVTYVPLVIGALFFVVVKAGKNRDFKSILIMASLFLCFNLSNQLIRFAKYGEILSPLPPIFYFFDFSIENIWVNFFNGFFSVGGLFFVNPIFPLGLVGLSLKIIELVRKKFLTKTEAIFLCFWVIFVFCHHLFILGYIVEDHLPGRIHLAVAPLLVVGLIALRKRISEKYQQMSWFICSSLSAWHIWLTFSYISINQTESYLVFQNIGRWNSTVAEGFKSYWALALTQLPEIGNHWFQIFVFSALVVGLYSILNNYRKSLHLPQVLVLLGSLSFLAIAFLNIYFGPRNVQIMKDSDFYKGKAIGDGLELYSIDYFLDMAKGIENRSDSNNKKKIAKIIDAYYATVSRQVILSTPELTSAIENRSHEFSIIIQMEKNKGTKTSEP